MNVNADFTLKAVMDTHALAWAPSPMAGVDRQPLDRVGDEVARASSIVRYVAGSGYRAHTHGGGEEILVLEGVFSDEHGHYPAGTYLRNPPGSTHTPYSADGCTLFVKLRQFHPADVTPVQIDTHTAHWYPGLVAGLSVMPLHDFDGVGTALVHPGVEEILVLKGVFHDEHGTYPQGTWIRSPRYSRHAPFTQSEGALIYVKTGHLNYPLTV